MRMLILAASVALALSGLDTRAAAAGAPAVNSPSVTTSSSPGAAASTATTSTSSTPSGSPATPANAGAPTNPVTGTDVNNSQPRFGPGGSFANDSGNRALGTSPGQTSSGTLVGNSGSGLDVGSNATLGTGATGTTAVTNADGTVSVMGSGGAPATTGAPVNSAVQPSPSYTITNTPLLDQAAREGRAKEAARRARGDEPRVYGIAPRTDNDLTWQMPDDRVIRY